MLIILFIILMIAIFARLTYFAVKLTWGFSKIIFNLVFIPASLVCLLYSTAIEIAFPVLVIVGILSLIKVK